MKSLGERIVYIRTKREMTQYKLAELVGVTKATMSKYENDMCSPSAAILKELADALNTSTDYLVGRTDDDTPIDSNSHWIKLSTEEYNAIKEARLLSPLNKGKLYERITVLLEDQTESNKIDMD